MVPVNVRAMDSGRGPTREFLEAGAAVGVGLERMLMPMVGFGIEIEPEQLVSTRVEIQVFPGGPVYQRQSGRALVGIVIKIR
jgi:hypothetical protein